MYDQILTLQMIGIRPKKKNLCFLLPYQPKFFGDDPKLFKGIFRQALLKSGSLFYIDYVNKIYKQKKIPYRPTLFLFDMQQQ